MNRDIGLEKREGHDVGRDPRAMTAQELERLGHRRLSPLKALRLRCLDCCCGSAREVRLCTAVDCPAWPFRTGKNPWRAAFSGAERARRAARLARQNTAGRSDADNYRDETAEIAVDGARPSDDGSRANAPEIIDTNGGLA